MKFTFDREKMLAAFQPAASVAPSRSPKPILQCVKMIGTENGATLMATDTEVGIRVVVEGVSIETPGNAVLPVDLFGNILRESGDDQLTVVVEGAEIKVTGGSSNYSLPSQNADEFPDVQHVEGDSRIEIAAGLFGEIVKRTVFATDNESSRYALGGILLETDGGNLIAVGTDGRRLAKMQGPVDIQGDIQLGQSSTIVPTRSMNLIARALGAPDSIVQIIPSDNQLAFKTEAVTLTSRLVEGRFPKWKDVFPARTESSKIVLAAGTFYGRLRQASIVANDESRGITFTFSDGTLSMDATAAERGQSHTEMPIAYTGNEVAVSLDHRYVENFLRVLDSETSFTFDLEGGQAAVLLSTEDGYSYIIMPLARDR
ncbi:MAG: DNA polymerase III subunit beta [Planctomycetaceae bacterium]|nr:DNA polymerase III subunit beta [Planctomycetaceae bacterium]|tara:strand:- start:833 stop:1948 length:1116 start_codon:yes stop_codon:yes gene_type:complete